VVCQLSGCRQVEGNLMDLAQMPFLEELNLCETRVTGDIRDVTEQDFVRLQSLEVTQPIFGGGPLSSVSQAKDVMQARYHIKRRIPRAFSLIQRLRLSEFSSDWYEYDEGIRRKQAPPFWVEFVQCGPRTGWRWTNVFDGGQCDIHWLEPEPQMDDDCDGNEYHLYLDAIDKELHPRRLYRGFLSPPTHEEHRTILAPAILVPIESELGFAEWWE